VPTYQLLRLEGPLQAWGDVAFDPRRPTRAFPSRSGLAGLAANALGWEHRDADRTTALQDALRYAVREDVPPVLLRDYQTADLGRIGLQGWTRWGMEKRGGSAAGETQILEKFYLADGSFLVALTLAEGAPVTLDEVQAALKRPARPLFLGRKGCPPSTGIEAGRQEAETAYEALALAPRSERAAADTPLRCWYSPGDGPEPHAAAVSEVWDRRDFATQRFTGSRRLVEGRVSPGAERAA
jgi:CRISPR system Cascade subunit CasD